MAIRSGLYKNINVMEVREGEYLGIHSQSGDAIIQFISNDEERLSKKVIGYYAYIKLTSGFEKSMYWSKEKMLQHADTYSAAFNKEAYKKLQEGKIPQQDLWKYSSFWYRDFDQMAFKTLLRQILSKWGILSTEMQEAFIKDDTSGDTTENRNYVDADYEEQTISDVNATQHEEVGTKEIPTQLKEEPKPKQPTKVVEQAEMLNNQEEPQPSDDEKRKSIMDKYLHINE